VTAYGAQSLKDWALDNARLVNPEAVTVRRTGHLSSRPHSLVLGFLVSERVAGGHDGAVRMHRSANHAPTSDTALHSISLVSSHPTFTMIILLGKGLLCTGFAK